MKMMVVSLVSKQKNHARSSSKGARPMAMSHRLWVQLDSITKASRIRALETLRALREGKSLTYSAKYSGLDVRTAKAHLKGFIFKRHGRYKARKGKDTIQRGLNIFSRAKVRSIIVGDSDTASQIGLYFNDVKRVLTSGNQDPLKKWKKVIIKDIYGREYRLETNVNNLIEIKLRQENLDINEGIYEW